MRWNEFYARIPTLGSVPFAFSRLAKAIHSRAPLVPKLRPPALPERRQALTDYEILTITR